MYSPCLSPLDYCEIINLIDAKLSPIIGNEKVFYWLPNQEVAGIYIEIMDISRNIDIVNPSERWNIRIVAGDDKILRSDMKKIEDVLINLLLPSYRKAEAIYLIGDKQVHNVTTDQNFQNWYDIKDRKVRSRDFTFYYTY